ncbi:MAG: TetR/AcrR family transcriptional regulator [Chloroflexi bacterium]|nr:MAG: TetR/AcrR family transcriptional regulator [Chloroflexota bacterium]
MTTADRILDAALELFNEQGVAPVSTNHIAAAAAMSPGNLYYHFRNKDEIVRSLFERLFDTLDRAFTMPDDRGPILEDVGRLVRINFDVVWEFRFAYRELPALLRHDDILRTRWLEVRRRGYEGFHAVIATFAAAGVIKAPPDPEAVERVADLCWLISEFWIPNLEVSGRPVDVTELERGITLMLQILNP